jgi:PAS domain S-box-containing protein
MPEKHPDLDLNPATSLDQFKEENERLISTLMNMCGGVISTDYKGFITLFNHTAEMILGFSKEAVSGKPFNNIFTLHEIDTRQPVSDPFSRLAVSQPGAARLQYFYLQNQDGSMLPISTSRSAVISDSGNTMGYVVTFNNITEQKQAESHEVLSQKMESIGQLASGIAHEINTPIQYIGDNTQFLSDAFQAIFEMMKLYRELADRLPEYKELETTLQNLEKARLEYDIEFYTGEIPTAVQQTLDGIEQVRKIVLALKAFSHPTGKDEKHWSDINRGIETALTLSRNEWKYIAEVEQDFDLSLPPVYCDINEINQVTLNLVINAAHAIQEKISTDSTDKGKITITTKNLDKDIQIIIQDTGSGIPPENLSRVFDPFFTTKEAGRGTGQGLALAHNIIVKHHQGQIWVESEAGKGTTFTVQIPKNDPNSTTEEQGV